MSEWNVVPTSGSSSEKAPPGNHPAVCVAIIDMGTQFVQGFQGAEGKWQRRAYFVWELVTKKQSGNPKQNHVIGMDINVSLNEKAKLAQWIAARTGKPVPASGYNIAAELGQPCLLNIALSDKGYPQIKAMAAVPEGLPVPKPQNTPILVTLEDFKRSGAAVVPSWVPYLFGRSIPDCIGDCKELAGNAAKTGGVPGTQGGPPPRRTPKADDGQPADHTRWKMYDAEQQDYAPCTAAQIKAHIMEKAVNPADVWVIPDGSEQEVRASEVGFKAPEIPF